MPGATILSLCQKGDELLEAETAKIYKGKKIPKGLCLSVCSPGRGFSPLLTRVGFAGIAFPTTVSANDILTPYTPIASDTEEAAAVVKDGDVLKIQFGLPATPLFVSHPPLTSRPLG